MALGNWRNGTSKSYDKRERYAQTSSTGDSGSSLPQSPAVAPHSRITHFEPRSAPPLPIYNPILGTRRRERRRAEQHVGDLRLATEVAEAATMLEGSMTKLEEARQKREEVQQRRVQLGAKTELTNLQLGVQVVDAQSAFEAAVENRIEVRLDRVRQRRLDSEHFEMELEKKKTERLDAEVKRRAAEALLARSPEIALRQAEAELHKATGTAFEHEADAEAERRRRDQERQRRHHDGNQFADVPEEFAVHYATENRVSTIRRHAEREAQKIRDAAARAGKELTPDQEAAIDALLNAADASEAAIRAAGATDLEL